jgi:alpha-N-arabinofuranosidase
MATFTKIPDSETPVVSVNHLNKIAKINDNVYGGFTEYVIVSIARNVRLTY